MRKTLRRLCIPADRRRSAGEKGARRRLLRQRQSAAAIVLCSALGLAVVVACGSAPKPGSIGSVLSHDRVSGELTVHEAPAGLAGDNAGLIEGDRIKMIDGVLVDELDGNRIRKLLRGPIGTTVTLTVLRGDEVVHIGIVRQPLGAGAPIAERHERIE